MYRLRIMVLLLCLAGCCTFSGCQGTTEANAQSLKSRAVERLRGSVNSSNRVVRMDAIQSVVDLRLSNAPEICSKAVSSPDPLMQFAGAVGLIQLPSRSAEKPLKDLLFSPDGSVKLAAAGALYKLGQTDRLGAVLQGLENSDETVRGNAVMILGRLGDESVVPRLRPLLKSEPVDRIRLQVAEALVLLGDSSVLPMIQLWEFSINWQERIFAVQLMGQAREEYDFTADLLQKLEDNNQMVQIQAARSLGLLGNDQGLGLAEKYIFPSSMTRQSLASQLGVDPNGSEMNTVVSQIRSLAALTLGDIGRWDSAHLLDTALDDEDQHVALAAAYGSIRLLIKNHRAVVDTLPQSAR